MTARRHPAYRKFRAFVLGRGLVHSGDTVLVSLSGGPDSTALLHLFLALAGDFPVMAAAAHFHHRLRAAADEDERFVKELCGTLGVRVFFGRRDVRSFARRNRCNIEEAGRTLRYEFLRRAAARCGAAAIATGHTMNDQAETMLMRIMRGTGPGGLAGIPSLRSDGPIIRPLLTLTRKDVLDYLRAQRVPFRTDESNRDESFLRNRVRSKLIPYLEKRFEPSIVVQLARLAEIAAEEDAFLDAAAQRGARTVLFPAASGARLEAAALAKLPRALARRVVRIFFRRLKGDLRGFSLADVDNVLTLAEGSKATVARGLILERRGGSIAPPDSRRTPAAYFILWDGRGAVPLPGSLIVLRGAFRRPADRLPGPAFDDRRGCRLDADTLDFPLVLRSRRPGDRYRPLGAPGTKKLKEIFRARKIPEDERDVRPVIVSGGRIVWCPGLPVAESAKITPGTKRILVLAVGREGWKKAPRTGQPAGRKPL